MKELSNSISKIRIIYVSTIIFLIALSFYSVIQLNRLIDSSDWVNHTSNVRLNLEKISSDITEAETYQRGFLLTGDTTLLLKRDEPFKAMKTDLLTLESLCADNNSQQESIRELRDLIDVKLRIMKRLMDEYVPSEANPEFKRNVILGAEKMNSVKAKLNKMAVAEMLLLEIRTNKYDRLSTITPIFIIVLFLGAITILAFSYFRINKAYNFSTQLQSRLMQEKTIAESIMQASVDNIHVLDKDLNILDINKKAIEHVPILRKDVKGKNILDVFPGMRESPAHRDLQLALKGETVHNKMYHSALTGKYYENYFIPLNIDGIIEGVVVVARDLSELISTNKQLEKQNKELDERNDFVEKLINSSPDLIMVIDKDLKILTTNGKANSLFNGADRGDIIGSKITELTPDITSTQSYESFLRAFNGEKVITEKAAALNADEYYKNSFIPLFNNKDVYAVMIISHNITKEVNNEKLLKESEEKFNKLFQLSPFSITVSEIPSGKFVDLNENYIKTFGFSREELIGKTSLELGMMDQAARTKITTALNENQSVKNMDVEVRNKAGEKIPVLVSIETISIGNQQFFLNAIIDIVEIKKSEEILHQTNIKLQQMNEELTAFTYISSHDLQEPLRKIQTFAERIMETEYSVLSENAREQFRRMQNAAKRMQLLIEDLLAYSRTNTEERNFESVDFLSVIEQAREDFNEELKQKGGTIKTIGSGVLRIIPFQFRQLLQNLVGNSLKFSKETEPPEITVSCFAREGADLNIDGISSKKKYVYIRISDNGIGFEPQYSRKIFEVFQRLHAKETYTGTGIGLAIVKKIVENHDGFIFASGEINKGAAFDIYLPADD